MGTWLEQSEDVVFSESLFKNKKGFPVRWKIADNSCRNRWVRVTFVDLV